MLQTLAFPIRYGGLFTFTNFKLIISCKCSTRDTGERAKRVSLKTNSFVHLKQSLIEG